MPAELSQWATTSILVPAGSATRSRSRCAVLKLVFARHLQGSFRPRSPGNRRFPYSSVGKGFSGTSSTPGVAEAKAAGHRMVSVAGAP